MNKGPDLPRSLARGEEIRFDFVSNCGERVTVHESKICEEYGHKKWAPEDLVNGHLTEDRLRASTLDLAIKPVVKVMTRRSVVKKSESRKGSKTLPVKRSPSNKNLSKGIS